MIHDPILAGLITGGIKIIFVAGILVALFVVALIIIAMRSINRQ